MKRNVWKKITGVVLSAAMVLTAAATTMAAQQELGWPLKNDTSYHLYRGVSGGHEGLDIAASDEQPVIAAADGQVKGIYVGCTNYDGYDETGKDCKTRGKCKPTYRSKSCPEGYTSDGFCNGGNGNCVIIYHEGMELATSYAHLVRIAPGLKEGDKVKKGQVIGYAGSTGRSSGTHLHIETREGVMGSSGISFWNNKLTNLLFYVPASIASKVNGPGSDPTETDMILQEEEIGSYGLGDVNYDGKITSKDALWVLSAFAGSRDLNDTQSHRADVDQSGQVDSRDALAIVKYVAAN